jgi:hypothetical protein
VQAKHQQQQGNLAGGNRPALTKDQRSSSSSRLSRLSRLPQLGLMLLEMAQTMRMLWMKAIQRQQQQQQQNPGSMQQITCVSSAVMKCCHLEGLPAYFRPCNNPRLHMQ